MDWRRPATIERNTKWYTDRQEAVRVLMGGIGAGNISIDSAGRMCDFEIFGHPDKGLKLPDTFFSIWSQVEGRESDARVLEAAPKGVNRQALGVPSAELPGLPRFDSAKFACRYPFVEFELIKKGFPLRIEGEAFTPFIPLDADRSAMPAFRMRYKVTNLAERPAQVSICGTLPNVAGFTGFDGFERFNQEGEPFNTRVDQGGLTGIVFGVGGLAEDHLTRGNLALMTDAPGVTVKPHWQFGGWWDGAEEFWQDFRADGELSPDVSTDSIGSNIASASKNRYIGSVASKQTIAPGETKCYDFYISWYFPNRYGWWPNGHKVFEKKPDDLMVWQNYFTTLWPDALGVCADFHKNREELEGLSRDFSDALYGSTLDADVIESLVSAIAVLRSPTCFRIADGHFYGWEGCFDHAGSCPGTCTHVWNYAQAVAFLFPELEQSARRGEFLEETDATGKMAFRAETLLMGKPFDMLPATDGQLGSILRVYREWIISGDDGFLRELWPKVKLSMDFSIKTWDSDGDYVLDDQQHNTYDIEFYGINSLTNSILYAALAACVKMAEYLGEEDIAEKWRTGLEKGAAKMDEMLWNGEYYIQAISDEDLNKYRYQYGKGCLTDQLLGQQLAHVYGLGYILPEEHVRSAVASIYKYNFRESLEEHHSVQRGYAYQDEGGLLACSWPHGGRPKQPFVYSDEIWTGMEYHVATHLIYEGMVPEALDIIHALRGRYDGNRRAPLNEVECGFHYARSMAAWGLLIALSGYRYDMTKDEISFDPKVSQADFSCFYSHGEAWGVYAQQGGQGGRITELYRRKK